MFVAIRDLRHARGRFALILLVVILTSLLVTFLSALTAGLSRESTSAVTELPADHLVFATPDHSAPNFMTSQLSPEQWREWSKAPAVTRAEPLGVLPVQAESNGRIVSVTVFGVLPGSHLLPEGVEHIEPGSLLLSSAAAEGLSADPGTDLTLAGHRFSANRSVVVERSFSHTPVVWSTLEDWRALTGERGGGGAVGTVLAVTADELSADTIRRFDAALGTTTVKLRDARSAVGSFSAENGSLVTIQAFLIVISALVVGAFFTVWTISRSGDVAVLKALGASTAYLLRDAVGQAALVLVAGVGMGSGLAAVGALTLRDVLPVVVDVTTTVLPAAALVLFGLAGAVTAIVRITRVDPHAALAAR
jgi:putative ABC transport system permease protein